MIAAVLGGLFTLQNFIFMNIGLASGIVVGALPGLTGTMAIALLLPMTYGLNSITGILLLLGVYCGGIYGGSITAILINTPGTPASAATALDGYAMAKNGEPKRALDLALGASLVGGILSTIALLFFAPIIAKFALKFGPAEYFSLAIFGLSIIASVGSGSIIKGLLMGMLGLFISAIGLDPIGGMDRFSIGITSLLGGIDIIPALIGLFAITEIMAKVHDINTPIGEIIDIAKDKGSSIFEAFRHGKTLLKSSAIGTFIGAIPGTGAAIASFLSYNEAKRVSKTPEEFGRGSAEGIVAPEAANNAVTGATLIPLLTLGIPGDTNTAVLIGALTMQGIIPGPQLFVQQREWVYTIMIGLLVVNLLMFLQGQFFVNVFSNITNLSNEVLVPILLILCVIGAFAVNNSTFEAVLMMVFGVVGYLLQKLDFPLTPMVIAIVLGPLAESNMRRALILSKGSWTIFLQKPISIIFLALAAIMIIYPVIKDFKEIKTD